MDSSGRRGGLRRMVAGDMPVPSARQEGKAAKRMEIAVATAVRQLQAWLTINRLALTTTALVTASASFDACYVYVTGPGTTQSLNKKKNHPTSPTAHTGDPPYEHHRRPTAGTHMHSRASNGASARSRRSAHLIEK